MSSNEKEGSAGKGDAIAILLKDTAGDPTHFKIRRTTKMAKVFTAYAQKKGLQKDSLVFLFDGQRVDEGSTPESLDMDENDQIDVMAHQLGGAAGRG